MDMDCSTLNKCFTCFENLSNEICYEIFEYLDFYYIYQIFSNLNNRYYNLVNYSIFPIKLNLLSMPKKAFQNYCKDIIIPNQHRIHSIHSTNPFLFDIPSTPFRYLFQFPQLRILILENFESEHLQYLLPQLNALFKLSSLIIKPIDNVHDKNILYEQIFRLPALYYCKVSFKQRYLIKSLPISNHLSSPIQHLVIDNYCCINYLNILLSYLPQLCRLSCNKLTGSTTFQHIQLQSIVLNNLIYLSFKIENLSFDDIESFFSKLTHQIQVFRLSADYDVTYLNADRWERFILTNLPSLRIFDLQLISKSHLNQNLPYISINQFLTSFWLKRKWFFRYEYEQSFAGFYSIQPYRRNSYTINNRSYRDTYPNSNKSIFHSVNHIFIRGDISIKKNLIDFPNVTELTLLDYSNRSLHSISMILDRLIPLTKLYQLSIDEQNDFCVSQLMDLLYFSPNIQRLIIHSISLTKISLNQIRQTQTYQTILKKNQITHITLTKDFNLETMQLFIHLCPRLEQLTIHLDRYNHSTIRNLLGHIMDSHYVPLLCLLNSNESLSTILRLDLSNDYLIKRISSDLYIWS